MAWGQSSQIDDQSDRQGRRGRRPYSGVLPAAIVTSRRAKSFPWGNHQLHGAWGQSLGPRPFEWTGYQTGLSPLAELDDDLAEAPTFFIADQTGSAMRWLSGRRVPLAAGGCRVKKRPARGGGESGGTCDRSAMTRVGRGGGSERQRVRNPSRAVRSDRRCHQAKGFHRTWFHAMGTRFVGEDREMLLRVWSWRAAGAPGHQSRRTQSDQTQGLVGFSGTAGKAGDVGREVWSGLTPL